MAKDKKEDLEEVLIILHFLKHEYGDGHSITNEGMKSFRDDFQIMKSIGKGTREAKGIVFKSFIATMTGAIIYATWVGVKAQFYPVE